MMVSVDSISLPDEDVRLYYAENALEYQTDESADVLFVELSATDLVDDPAVEVTARIGSAVTEGET